MKIRIRLAGHVCGLIFFCSLAACAPSTTDKPGATPAPRSDSDTSANDPRAGEGQRAGTKESETGSSSLKQMQEGKSSATPASSPLKDVFYEFDRYDLSADARGTLRANADWLKSNPSARVEIEGHCDERGTNEYNLALGAKRAQVAKDFLINQGVATERLVTISYGKEAPACFEPNEECRVKNRRARFVMFTEVPTS